MKKKARTLGSMKKFIAAVEKIYGKKALTFPVEVHRAYMLDDETLWRPEEIEFLGVAQYESDRKHTVIIR